MTLPSSIVLALVLVLCSLFSACAVGPRSYSDDEKRVLGQTKAIWVVVEADLRNMPAGAAGVWTDVRRDAQARVEQIGIRLAQDERSADATLRLYLDFVYVTPLNAVASQTTREKQAPHMGIQARLTHRHLGNLFQYSEVAPSPYHSTFTSTDLIKHLGYNIQLALYKSTTAQPQRETCPTKLDYKGPPPATRVESRIRASIDATGRLAASEQLTSTGMPDLDRALAQQWAGCRFTPAYKDGLPVPDVITLTGALRPVSR